MSFPKKHFGRGVRRVPGQMNGWEKAWAQELEKQKLGGLILGYWFDSVKLRLAESTFYTPDFLVLHADFALGIDEVKGHWEDDARVKIKVAADKFPLRVRAITREKGIWKIEDFGKEEA